MDTMTVSKTELAKALSVFIGMRGYDLVNRNDWGDTWADKTVLLEMVDYVFHVINSKESDDNEI